MMKIKIVLALAAFSAAILLYGNAEVKKYTALYSEKYPVMDGKIESDPAWKGVPWNTGDFTVHRKKGIAPKNSTRFKALYTADALYVAAECGEQDIAKLKKVFNFNEFWIYDTLEFFMLPAKGELLQFITNYEGMRFETIPGNVSRRANFQTGWDAAGVKGEKSWSAEICIPFYLIGKVPVGKTLSIPFNVCRNSTTAKERSTWSYQPKAFSNSDAFGILEFAAAPQKVAPHLEKAMSRPHWISLIKRWEEIRSEASWQNILAKFRNEKEELERLYKDKLNYAENSGRIAENLLKIESYVKEQEKNEKKRIIKRLFED